MSSQSRTEVKNRDYCPVQRKKKTDSARNATFDMLQNSLAIAANSEQRLSNQHSNERKRRARSELMRERCTQGQMFPKVCAIK